MVVPPFFWTLEALFVPNQLLLFQLHTFICTFKKFAMCLNIRTNGFGKAECVFVHYLYVTPLVLNAIFLFRVCLNKILLPRLPFNFFILAVLSSLTSNLSLLCWTLCSISGQVFPSCASLLLLSPSHHPHNSDRAPLLTQIPLRGAADSQT